MLLAILLALFPTSVIAWRYAKAPADPDYALFNLPAICGSWYGRDFPDCKTPAIHVWFWLLSKIVGRDIARIKFAHHFIIGAAGSTLVLLLQGNFWKALAFATLINSAWLYAFHGNVGQVPALLVLGSLLIANQPWLAAGLALAAVLFEPKLLPSFGAMVIIYGWWLPAAIYAAIGAICWLLLQRREIGRWIWESSVTIPMRIAAARGKQGWSYPWVPWYTAVALLYLLPWTVAAVWSRSDLIFWIPAVIYMIVISLGKVIRNNHLLPIVPWIALAIGMPEWVLALTAIDWLTSGLYLGNLWFRFYPSINQSVHDARVAGEWLKDKPGSLWSNGMFSACVYLYSGKPVDYGLTENIEVREVAHERVKAMKRMWKGNPADWIVETDNPLVRFTGKGYSLVGELATVKIWRRND